MTETVLERKMRQVDSLVDQWNEAVAAGEREQAAALLTEVFTARKELAAMESEEAQ